MSGARVQPHDLAAEAGLLGAMLLSRDVIGLAAETVVAGDFYKPAHGHVFEAIVSLDGRGDPADPLTVLDELRRTGMLAAAGGDAVAGDMVSMQGGTPAIGHARRYATIVAELSTLRRLVGVASEISELGYTPTDDVPGTLDRAEALVFALSDIRRRRDLDRIDASPRDEWLDVLEQRLERDGPAGISTGWSDLDELTLGLHDGQLITVAGRTSMGKSAFTAGLAANVAREGQPVLLVSAEMSRLELMDRIVAAEARVGLQGIRSGRLSPADLERVHATVARLDGLPVYVDADPGASLLSIRAQARRVVSREGRLGVIVVDYLQLLTPAGRAENRQVEVATLSRGLKRLALELNVPVVAASQLNREIEHRAEKRPGLADLRESGAIEQDSDVVMLLYRDEVYNPKSADAGVAEIIVAKQRNGPTGTVRLAFLAPYGRFATMRAI